MARVAEFKELKKEIPFMRLSIALTPFSFQTQEKGSCRLIHMGPNTESCRAK